MKRSSAFVVTATLVILAGVYLGARLIYFSAWEDSLTSYMATEAVFTAEILRRLRAGQIDDAVQLLEVQLDGQIIGGSMHSPGLKNWLADFESDNFTVAELLCKAAPYRSQHKTPTADFEPDMDKFVSACIK